MRNNYVDFIDTDPSEILSELVQAYEGITGRTLQPTDPERLFIAWVCDFLVRERINLNYVGNQNIASRADGENLDALGQYIYGIERDPAVPATATVRFTITQELDEDILIVAGTRVTDLSQTLVWHTADDATITAGNTFTDIAVECETAGAEGNGYAVGQINTLIDVDNVHYFSSVTNTTESEGGVDEETDEEYFDRMRLSLDIHSTAGATGSYVYYAKTADNDISDVVANSPSAGVVKLFAIMGNGTAAGNDTKDAILDACNSDDVRPLTDKVIVGDPEAVDYSISFTYYLPKNSEQSTTQIAANISEAVAEYNEWQQAKLGRAINPAKLWQLIMQTGITRADIITPVYSALNDGSSGETPQYARLSGTPSMINGGYEDE